MYSGDIAAPSNRLGRTRRARFNGERGRYVSCGGFVKKHPAPLNAGPRSLRAGVRLAGASLPSPRLAPTRLAKAARRGPWSLGLTRPGVSGCQRSTVCPRSTLHSATEEGVGSVGGLLGVRRRGEGSAGPWGPSDRGPPPRFTARGGGARGGGGRGAPPAPAPAPPSPPPPPHPRATPHRPAPP